MSIKTSHQDVFYFATKLLPQQELANRGNFTCAYHNPLHVVRTLIVLTLLVDKLKPLIEQIANELDTNPQDLSDVFLYGIPAMGGHDLHFELNDLGQPDKANEAISLSQTLAIMREAQIDIDGLPEQIISAMISHTPVSFADGVIASNDFTGTALIQFAQLMAELCDKANTRTFNKGLSETFGQSFDSEIDKGVFMNILLFIEIHLRSTLPLTAGQAYLKAQAYVNQIGHEALANKAIEGLIGFTRKSVVEHIQLKLQSSLLVYSPTLMAVIEELLVNHSAMITVLESALHDQTTTIKNTKQNLVEMALQTLEIPSC
jgi:hypothetical protein